MLALFLIAAIPLTLAWNTTVDSETGFIHTQIRAGRLRGITQTWSSERTWSTTTQRTIQVFYNIPYARPPTGYRRFQTPEPVFRWSGVWDSSVDRGALTECIQLRHVWGGENQVIGDEDCLYLSVYTRAMPIMNLESEEQVLRPVIVYIHGGSFMFGSQKHVDPKPFVVDHNIVFVKINYRLGPFGFLSTGDKVVPGNMGLHDQIMALEWVKKNIKQFGGDPEMVTIAGSYAGGASVHFHMLSRRSKGLFQRAISISGTMVSPWAMAENLVGKTKLLGRNVGCYYFDSSKDMVSCLQTRPASYIAHAVRETLPFLYNPVSPWGPTVDAFIEHPLLPSYPGITMSKSNGSSTVPWLVGISNVEGLYIGSEMLSYNELMENIEKYWPSFAPYVLDYDNTIRQREDHIRVYADRIMREYFKKFAQNSSDSENESASKETNRGKKREREGFFENVESCRSFCQMIGDRLFVSTAESAARWMAKSEKAPVYFFMYDQVKNNFSVENKSAFLAEAHLLDDSLDPIQFKQNVLDPTPQEKTSVETLIELMASFAQTGRPTNSMNWPRVTPDLFSYMEIVNGTTKRAVQHVKELGKREFWNSMSFKEFTKYPKPKKWLKFSHRTYAQVQVKEIVENPQFKLGAWRISHPRDKEL